MTHNTSHKDIIKEHQEEIDYLKKRLEMTRCPEAKEINKKRLVSLNDSLRVYIIARIMTVGRNARRF